MHIANCVLLFQDQWTPLHIAANEGHLAVVKLLTSHKADVNSLNKVATMYVAVTIIFVIKANFFSNSYHIDSGKGARGLEPHFLLSLHRNVIFPYNCILIT